jgi:hypothetical protein
MIHGYHDCLMDNSPSGLTVLCQRLLEALDFKVLVVNHWEVQPHQKPLDRARMLEKKLKELLLR